MTDMPGLVKQGEYTQTQVSVILSRDPDMWGSVGKGMKSHPNLVPFACSYVEVAADPIRLR